MRAWGKVSVMARLCALTLVGVGLTSCGKEGGSDADPVTTLPAGVVLQVADETVREAEFKRHLGFEDPARTGGDAADTNSERQVLRQRVFEKLLMATALELEARRLGITVSEERVRAEAEQTKTGLGTEGYKELIGPYTDRDFRTLVGNGMLLEKMNAAARKRGETEKWLSTGQARDLPARWREKTVCGAGFDSVACQG